MDDFVRLLPHVNVALNSAAAVLLVVGFLLIKRGRETAHKWTMISCFIVSILFLSSYLLYHSQVPSKKFPLGPPAVVRYVYWTILATHVILAASVPFLAIATIFLGLKDYRRAHRRLAKWTFPIWLYVSITGVIVYLMLYQFFSSSTA